jgi:hypothetical protein
MVIGSSLPDMPPVHALASTSTPLSDSDAPSGPKERDAS